MVRFLLRRTVSLVLCLGLAIVAVFVLLQVLPAPGRVQPQVFVDWLRALGRFDLGTSIIGGYPITPEIGTRLGITLPLALVSFVLALALAGVLGYQAAVRQGTRAGTALGALAHLGAALPVFWVGILLAWLVGSRLTPDGFPAAGWAAPRGALLALLLPLLTLVIAIAAALLRRVTPAVTAALATDHLRHARALGAGDWEAFARHGLRHAAVPVVAGLGIDLAATLLGTLLTEAAFGLPGLGGMLVEAISRRDYPVVEAVLLVATLLVLVVGFLADLALHVVDPRLRARAAGVAP